MDASGLVQVWYERFPNPAPPELLAGWLGELSPDERERAFRYRSDADRACYAAAHALLRRALSQRTGVPPGALRFRSEAHGKPEVEGPAEALGIRFSLSHTRGFAVCAVSTGMPLGVDVERADREPPSRIASAALAPPEREVLESLPPDERAGRFFHYWTLKEALLKGLGLGLTYTPAKLSFALSPESPPTIDLPAELDRLPGAWRFESWLLEEYRVSLALRTGGAACPVTISEASLCRPRHLP